MCGLRKNLARIIQYLLLTVAGIVALVRPTPNVYDILPHWVSFIWATFFVVGGAAAVAGALLDIREVEGVGIPLLVAACFAYSSALLYQSSAQGPGSFWIFIFVGLIILSYGFSLTSRWLAALHLARIHRSLP